MKYERQWILAISFLLVIMTNFSDALDCYYCANCLNTQRGIRLPARSEDWCYKVVWRSGTKNQQIVSRGASADCRQDSYQDPSMTIQGMYSGTARYCCRSHLCNSTPIHVYSHEIFYTFTNVSSHIDNVLLAYSSYCVNFKSITKKEFESVCQRIVPDQVISLTLSDNEQTPGQVERFLSRFQMNQFTRLRSLTLVDVGPDFWEPIVTKLVDLKNLRSFIYDLSSRNDSWISRIVYADAAELDERMFNSYGPVLPQLNRLKLSHGNFLASVQFPYLHHLIVKECKFDIIKQICCAAPQLKSLEAGFRYDQSTIELRFPLDQLIRLVLRIEGSAVSINTMEQLMANLPSLKYLELYANGYTDLFDGQRWQMITSRLITFNFLFSISHDIDVPDLDSFRSSFWLNEKHWFVAYAYGSLFSVPHFAETQMDEDFQLPVLSTVSDINIYYEHITQLTLHEAAINIQHRFTHVQTLVLINSFYLPDIERIVDLNRIQHLILCSTPNYFELMILINKMPTLYRISIRNKVKYFLKEIEGGSFDQIRNLEIGNSYSSNNNDDGDNYSVKQLYVIFPYVEHLHVRHSCSTTQILQFINQFRQLSTASFHCTPWYTNAGYTDEHIMRIRSALNKNRSLQKLDYTYRFDRSSLHIWL